MHNGCYCTPLSFFVLGDWGGEGYNPYYTPAEASVSHQMVYLQNTTLKASFVLALGDNFYDYGVRNEFDPRFEETFEDVFPENELPIPWYVLAGNHDHYGNVTGEIEYSNHSKRWNFPNLFYTKIFDIPGKKHSTLQIIFIDTVQLAGLSHPIYRSAPYMEIVTQDVANLNWAWIENELSKSKATWLIVAGHYPVWSIAEHGPTSKLVNRLRPLLNQYKVHAYICGHDHNMQYIRENGSNVDYFVIGAGHLIDPSTKNKNNIPIGSLKFHYGSKSSHTDGAFAYFEATEDDLNITYVNYKGVTLFTRSRSDPRY